MSKPEVPICDVVCGELKSISLCHTVGGILKEIPGVMKKVSQLPKVYLVFQQLEAQDLEEGKEGLRKRQVAFEWFCQRFVTLLAMKRIWTGEQALQKLERWIRGILEFRLVGGNGGYLQIMNDCLRQAANVAVKYKENHSVLAEWVKIGASNDQGFYVTEWRYPDVVQELLCTQGFQRDLYAWRVLLDGSFLAVYRFVKILAQHGDFERLPAESACIPANFQEFESRQVRYYIGAFFGRLSCQEGCVPSVDELVKLIQRFIYLLQQAISSPELRGPALKQKKFQAAREYCINELVEYVLRLEEHERIQFFKGKYEVEIFEWLVNRARQSHYPFAGDITKTMVRDESAPIANRILREQHGIIWHPSPKKQG